MDEDLPDLNDPELEKAATKIQATFKGYKTRKEVGKAGGTSPARPSSDNQPSSSSEPVSFSNAFRCFHCFNRLFDRFSFYSQIDIDLTDPDVEKAATKIQATFKGYKARKEVKGQLGGQNS